MKVSSCCLQSGGYHSVTLKPMLLHRVNHCIIAIDDSIYVLGGFDEIDGNDCNDVEKYVNEEYHLISQIYSIIALLHNINN